MPEDFEKNLNDALDAADSALDGSYKRAMRELLALSMTDIKKTIPSVSYADYSRLMTVVEQASAANVVQAELKEKIVFLGSAAVRIAKLVPSLAGIFA